MIAASGALLVFRKVTQLMYHLATQLELDLPHCIK